MINTEVEKAAKNDEYECIGVSNEDVIYILNLLRECGYTLKENHSPISTDGSNTITVKCSYKCNPISE